MGAACLPNTFLKLDLISYSIITEIPVVPTPVVEGWLDLSMSTCMRCQTHSSILPLTEPNPLRSVVHSQKLSCRVAVKPAYLSFQESHLPFSHWTITTLATIAHILLRPIAEVLLVSVNWSLTSFLLWWGYLFWQDNQNFTRFLKTLGVIKNCQHF